MSDYYAEDFIRSIVEAPKNKTVGIFGVRKIVQGIDWEIRGAWPQVSYEDLGYGKNKFKQLQRNYFDAEELARVKSQLQRRKGAAFTSIAMSMRAGKKDSRSMGHCMQNLVVSTTSKGFLSAELQYRSTEAILKFGGDIVFLPWLFDQLEINPQVVRFHFANAYLSGVFFPTLMRWWEPVNFLDYLWDKEPALFAGGTRFLLRSAYQQDQHFPYSPEALQHRYLWDHFGRGRIRRIREYLETKHKTFGKPLPRTHHKQDGSYIPRGRRVKP